MAKQSKKLDESQNLPTYNVPEAASFIKQVLSMPPEDAPSVCMVGGVGIGKTRIGEGVPRSMGMTVRTRHLAQIHPLDLGCVGIDAQTREMYFAKPALVQELEQVEGRRVLFLDEIDRVQPVAQSAMLQLLLDKKLNGYPLQNTYIIGAGNGWYAQYTFEMDKAFASRLAVMHVVTEHEGWLKWASEHGVHPSIITTIAMAPDCLNQHTELGEGAIKVADPRAWETLSRALKAGVTPAHAAAFVGEHAARTFTRHMSFSQDFREEIAQAVKGKLVDVDESGSDAAMLLFGIYLSAAGMVALDTTTDFLSNCKEQLGKEKAYIVGRVLSYHIPPQKLLANKDNQKLHKELLEAYEKDE